MRNILIFDLDETIIDSSHRTPNNPDGTLNLAGYIARHTPENVARDTLLPLVRVMRQRYDAGDYIIICTARDMLECDYSFLKLHNIPYHKIMSRDIAKPGHYKLRDGEYKKTWLKPYLNLKQFKNKPVIMFDDAKPVKSAVRGLGFPVLCAHKLNAKLAA